MSKSKTRSSKVKTEDEEPSNTKMAKAQAFRKVFFIPESWLKEENGNITLKLEKFYHPGKGKPALFITNEDNKQIMEVLEFAEPRRSWLINSDVCSNGKIYLTTEIDVTFLALHHLRKYCSQKAQALDAIHSEDDDTVGRMLTTFVKADLLQNVVDVKKVGDDCYYKYNAEKALTWLAVKTRRVAEALKKAGVHAGVSAQSQNFTRSETMGSVEEAQNPMDFLRMACDYVGGYLDLDLYDDLVKYLEIPKEKLTSTEDKKDEKKRKSQQALDGNKSKKVKLEANVDGDENDNTAAAKLKNSSLLDESLDKSTNSIESKSPIVQKATPLQERTLSAKEKALAKGAKGTKSIASFFKK